MTRHQVMISTPCSLLVATQTEVISKLQIRIDNSLDPRLDPYRNIKERDLVKNKRQFIAEGKTVLQVLVQQDRFKLHSLLILENRLEGLNALIDKIDAQIPTYVVPKSIMDEVAGFPMHRGVLALGEAPDTAELAKKDMIQWKRVVVLSGLSNHDNVGSVFRNAAAFKTDAVLLDQQCCDPLYRKAIRVSVGGVFKVPYVRFESLKVIIKLLNEQNLEIIALSPNADISLQNWKPEARSAIVLGTEGDGLPRNVLDRLKSVKIEMANDFDSLNVATASGIALHHMASRQT